MNTTLKLSGILALIMITLWGCAGMSETQQRAATGTLIGAGAGGIIGAIAGNAGMGAAIGAGTGLVGGYLYGKHKESEDEAYQRGVYDGRQGR
jgi:hypothetical protein